MEVSLKYTIHINQKQALELGIKNINQAVIFDLLTGCAAWANPIIINKEVYYWVARQKIAEQLPILGLKPDTIYRHLKSLVNSGMIDFKKQGMKDCIKITELGKSYYVGNKSELTHPTMSDLNPNHYVGFKSESNSEINPTYKTNNKTNKTKEDKAGKKPLPDLLNKNSWNDFVEFRKGKTPLTELAKKIAIKKLITLTKDQQSEVIEYSIMGGYTGIFLDKTTTNQPQPTSKKAI